MRSLALAIIVLISLAGCAPLDPGFSSPDAVNGTPLDIAPAAQDEITAEPVMNEDLVNDSQDDLPTKTLIEGELLSFPRLKANDPDGDPITYRFSAPLNNQGQWQTAEGDAGEYLVNITASDGYQTATQTVRIVVMQGNRAPVLSIPDLTITVKPGDTVFINASASDPDGNNVTLTYSGWMTTSTRRVTYNDVGSHNVKVIASDGKRVVSDNVRIRVAKLNRPPVISGLLDMTVLPGESIKLTPHVTDPDGDDINVTFSAPLDENGAWTPALGVVGKYNVTVTASDGDMSTLQSVIITVERQNSAPSITLESKEITVVEGETVIIRAQATDPDGDNVTLSYSGWMNAASYTTGYDDAGTHSVTVTASDGKLDASKKVTVKVMDLNRPPVFDPQSFS